MFKKTITTLALTTTLAVSVSVPSAQADERLLGTLIGAAGGAAVGSNIGKGKGNTVAIAAGTLIGAAFGNSLYGQKRETYTVTKSYDTYDYGPPYGNAYGHKKHHRRDYTPAYYNSRPNYNRYDVSYYAPPQEYCREYTQTVKIGGRTENSYGHACLMPDGSWQVKD